MQTIQGYSLKGLGSSWKSHEQELPWRPCNDPGSVQSDCCPFRQGKCFPQFLQPLLYLSHSDSASLLLDLVYGHSSLGRLLYKLCSKTSSMNSTGLGISGVKQGLWYKKLGYKFMLTVPCDSLGLSHYSLSDYSVATHCTTQKSAPGI